MECPKCHSQNPDDTRFCGMCATKLDKPEQSPASPTEVHLPTKTQLISGSLFAGRYRIIEELGKGGMGRVYKVWDTEVEEKVALKLLSPETAADEKTIERFRNELKLARQISHRNICRVYDLGKEEEFHYITMEYVPGEDLKSSIKRMGRLSAEKAIGIARQVCRGLTEAHRLGVVHRDLKPQNIMVDKEGNARIMDFGIARSLKTEGITETGIIIGTPKYMSVEQLEGKEVDQRSDIYSLGVILYEMVTGSVPFDGDTPLSIAVKHTTAKPLDPREINSQIPEELSRTILRCMHKNKKHRYQSAEELLAELNDIEKYLPTTTIEMQKRKSITSKEITVSFRPKKALVPGLLFGILLVAGLIIWQALSREPTVTASPVKPSLAILYFENGSGDATLDYWDTGLSELITSDLRQSRFLHVLSGKRVWGIVNKLDLNWNGRYSSADLKKLATKGKVEYVLTGSFAASGQGLVVTAILQNPHTGLVMSTRRVECPQQDDLFARIDQLTRRIKSDLGLPPEYISKDTDEDIAEILTGSTDAYQNYVQGRMNFLEGGSSARTIEFMEKAVASDPEFAMAYRTMAGAYNELGLISKAWHSLKEASELKHRLSLREYYLVQGELYSMSEETDDKALEAYNRLLEIYPEDPDANFNLGFLLCSDLEQWDEAARRFEVLVQNNGGTPEPYVYQAEAYMAMGKYDLAGAVLEKCLTKFPEETWLCERISSVYLYQNKLNLALQEAQQSIQSDPLSVCPSFVGDVYHCRGDWARAETEYGRELQAEGVEVQCHSRMRLGALCLSQARFDEAAKQFKQASILAEKAGDAELNLLSQLWLVRLNLAAGRTDEALKQWKTARSTIPEGSSELIPLLHLGALVQLKKNSTAEAKRLADELRKTILAKSNKRLMRYYHHLMGMIELENGDASQAIPHFQTALSLLPFQHSKSDDNALFFYPLAVAFYEWGDLEKAQEQFKKVTSLTTGRLFFGDLFARSIYMLGRIYQEKGWGEEAARHYAHFIQLWEGHDLRMPEFEDARQRLAQLESGA